MHSNQRTHPDGELSDQLAGRLSFFRSKRDAFASPREVNELQDDEAVDCQVVDVRVGPPDLLDERVSGAVHVPAPTVTERLDAFSPGATIVVYCWETFCSLATKAAIPLLERGYDVRELHGGIAAWNTLGLPTEPVESTARTRPTNEDAGCDC